VVLSCPGACDKKRRPQGSVWHEGSRPGPHVEDVPSNLTFVAGQSPQAAIGLIRQRRSGVSPNWEAYYGCRDDLVRCHKERIAERAYRYYQRLVHGDATKDWQCAEAEVLRETLTAGNMDST